MQKPSIFDCSSPEEFVRLRIQYLSATTDFSIRKACKNIRGLSQPLVSQVCNGKRTLTLDRAEGFAKLLQLTTKEKSYFISWLEKIYDHDHVDEKDDSFTSKKDFDFNKVTARRKDVSLEILQDWLNVYVKDAVRIAEGTDDLDTLGRVLGGIASQKRIEKSLKFLLREGYLRKNLDGKLIEDAPLMVATSKDKNKLIRNFHKASLKISIQGIDLFDPDERVANAMVFPVNKDSMGELKEIMADFAEKLQHFAEKHHEDDERLYQLVINLCPTGGSK